MNSCCVYFVKNPWHIPVLNLPQFVRRNHGFEATSLTIHYAYLVVDLLSALFKQPYPRQVFQFLQITNRLFSTFPRSLLLLLLFIYKKG